MSHPLSFIIRNVNSSEMPKSNEELKFYLNNESKIVVDKKPILSFKSYQAFIIKTDKAAVSKGLSYKANDFDKNKSLNLFIDYEAKCPKHSAKKLICALSEGDNPGETFDKLLTDTIDDFQKRKSIERLSLVLDFYLTDENNEALYQKLQSELSRILGEKTGLELKIAVRPEYFNKLRSKELKSTKPIEARVSDFSGSVKLDYEIKLDIDENNKIYAILNYNSINRIEGIIESEISKFLLKEVTLHDFFFNLNKSIKKSIIDNIDKRIIKHGRKIAFLNLIAEKEGLKPEDVPITNFDVECEIKEYPDPVLVKNRISMQIDNLGKFKNSNVKDVKQWIGNRLSRITKDTLFYKTYTDILLETNHPTEEGYEAEIIRKMKVEINKIGYSINQLLVIPDLKPLRLKDGFIIEFEQAYSTKDSGVFIKLGVIISGQILDLNKIEKYLNPKINIKRTIRNVASTIIEQITHKTDSHRAYMEFYEGDPSLEFEIKETVEKKLISEFYISDLSIILKSLETPIRKRFRKLQKLTTSFHFEVIPSGLDGEIIEGDSLDDQKVGFIGHFNVLGVSRWDVFKAKDFDSTKAELNAIKESFERGIKKKLRLSYGAALQSNNSLVVNEIEVNVKKFAKKVAEEEFGLFIEIAHFDRDELLSEKVRVATLEEAIQKSEVTKRLSNQLILDRSNRKLNSLLQKEEQLLALGYNDDHKKVKKVKEKIENISKELPENRITKKIKMQINESKKLISGVFNPESDENQKKGKPSSAKKKK